MLSEALPPWAMSSQVEVGMVADCCPITFFIIQPSRALVSPQCQDRAKLSKWKITLFPNKYQSCCQFRVVVVAKKGFSAALRNTKNGRIKKFRCCFQKISFGQKNSIFGLKICFFLCCLAGRFKAPIAIHFWLVNWLWSSGCILLYIFSSDNNDAKW